MYNQEYKVLQDMIKKENEEIDTLESKVEALKVEVDKALIERDTAILNDEDKKASKIAKEIESMKSDANMLERRIEMVKNGMKRKDIYEQADKVVQLMLQDIEEGDKEAADLEEQYKDLTAKLLGIAAAKADIRRNQTRESHVIKSITKALPEYKSEHIREGLNNRELKRSRKLPTFSPITQNMLFDAQGGW